MIAPDDIDSNIAEGTHNPAAIIGNLRMSGNKSTIPAPSPSSAHSDDEGDQRPRKHSKVGRPKKVQWDDKKVKIQDEDGKEVLPPNTKVSAPTTDGEQKEKSQPLLTEMEKKAMEWRKQHPVEDEPKIVEVAKSVKPSNPTLPDAVVVENEPAILRNMIFERGDPAWLAMEEARQRKKMIMKGLVVVGAAAVAYVGGKATWWVLSNTVGRLFGASAAATPAALPPTAESIMALAEKLEKLSAAGVVASVPQ